MYIQTDLQILDQAHILPLLEALAYLLLQESQAIVINRLLEEAIRQSLPHHSLKLYLTVHDHRLDESETIIETGTHLPLGQEHRC